MHHFYLIDVARQCLLDAHASSLLDRSNVTQQMIMIHTNFWELLLIFVHSWSVLLFIRPSYTHFSLSLCYARSLINLVNTRSSRCSINPFSFSLIGHYCHTLPLMTFYVGLPHLWVFPRLMSRSEISENVGNNLFERKNGKRTNSQSTSWLLLHFLIR